MARCYGLRQGAVAPPDKAKATVSAPPLRTVRREKRDDFAGAFMSPSLSGCRHHGAHDRACGCRSGTDFHRAPSGFPPPSASVLLDSKRGRAHDHAAGAVAALWHLFFDERRLDRMRLDADPSPSRVVMLALRIRDRHLCRIAPRVRRRVRCRRRIDQARSRTCCREAKSAQAHRAAVDRDPTIDRTHANPLTRRL